MNIIAVIAHFVTLFGPENFQRNLLRSSL